MKLPNRFLASVAVLASISSGIAAQEACDRTCLGSMLDQYLAAVVNHDPGAAPLAVGIDRPKMRLTWRQVMEYGNQLRHWVKCSGNISIQ